ncbi:MAG TPA: hypothetical protein VLX64_00535, partial [Thermoplasmata archaeon]|nr:hypothetical protein [Thermoplasmata archaeon]
FSYAAVVIIVVLTAEFSSLLGTVSLSTLHAPYASVIWPYLVLIVATAVASGAIADDLGNRSITLYLSRPIHLTDYLGAKTAAVAVWVALPSIGPGVVGVVIAAGLGLLPATVSLEGIGAFVAVGLLTTGFFTTLGIALSTLTSRALFAGVALFGATLSAHLAALAVSGATGANGVLYLSPITDLLTVADAAFSTGAADPISALGALAVLLGASVVLGVVAFLRLTRVEVVGE